jgi:hypothetical protein
LDIVDQVTPTGSEYTSMPRQDRFFLDLFSVPVVRIQGSISRRFMAMPPKPMPVVMVSLDDELTPVDKLLMDAISSVLHQLPRFIHAVQSTGQK